MIPELSNYIASVNSLVQSKWPNGWPPLHTRQWAADCYARGVKIDAIIQYLDRVTSSPFPELYMKPEKEINS